MATTHVFAGVAVTDLTVAGPWYERLFGRRPDRYPHEREAVWNLTAQGSVYVTVDSERAGAGLLTFAVSDLAAEVARLRAAGIIGDEHVSDGDGPRRLELRDADGNLVKLFQDPG